MLAGMAPTNAAARMIPVHSLTADDLVKIQDAHAVLQRVGNETAVGGEWNEYVDRAHHGLGLILAVHAAAEMTAPGD